VDISQTFNVFLFFLVAHRSITLLGSYSLETAGVLWHTELAYSKRDVPARLVQLNC
jgi:hypothetical protein